MSHSGWVHVDGCTIRKVTEKAVLIETDDWREWIPLSQIADADDLEAGDEGVTVSITEWIADQKGIE